MQEKELKLKEWYKLYQAAIEFRNMKPWEWMYDDEIFGVQDPITGEIGYCCIMGNMGGHFGIAAYLGAEGLNGILSILSGEVDPEDPDTLYMQKCLMASFEDRERLSKEDRRIIKELDLKFRGRNQWPLFRKYTPGFFPWYISKEECEFLTHILVQAMQVAKICRDEDKAILYHEEPLTFFVKVPENKNNAIEWHDEYIKARPFNPQYASLYLEDEIKLRRLKQLGRRRGPAWEMDTFYCPWPVTGEDRPYYPKICLVIDQSRGMILCYKMIKDMTKEGFKFFDMFIEILERQRQFPSRVLVQREETYCLVKGICGQLGINLEKVKKLHILQDARYEMYNYFNGLY
ncbi:MAG: hypothetical protein GX754_07795 [Clostridiaceae bacterium]|nr:hypothetical protein [Clostridiaceae bacterium]